VRPHTLIKITAIRQVSATLVGLFALTVSVQIAFTHPGGTDDEGCHTCRTNCDKWDVPEGQKHCHGDDSASNPDVGTKQDGSESNSDVSGESRRAKVVDVVDGDTLDVEMTSEQGETTTVRVLGIDCPESSRNSKCRRDGDCSEDIPEGKKASNFVRELIAGETVELEPGEDGFEKGSYGRLLAYIRTSNGRDLGYQLVELGLCQDYGDEYPHARGEQYRQAGEQKRGETGE
jgi:endonuclease YncB( thermonuclease family)